MIPDPPRPQTRKAEPRGPLAGVKVLELGGIGPNPFAALQLAGMGADVVCVNRPSSVGGESSEPVFLGQGKRSIAVDLRKPEGATVILELAEGADIVMEGLRPGVVERLGIGPEECMARNPALVYGRMTGWGQHGPWSMTAGHDVNYIALTGALHAIGRNGSPPTIPLALVGDLGGGAMFLVAGVIAALFHSLRTGEGQVVDAAIVDGAAALMEPFYQFGTDGVWRDERGVNWVDSGRPWYDVYETRDGGYMAVGALEPQFYDAFTQLLGVDASQSDRDDPARWADLRALFAQRFRSEDRRHWESVFEGSEACVAPVLGITEAAKHPHMAARGVLRSQSGTDFPRSATAPRFSGHSATPLGRRPRPGQHTREVLAEWIPDFDAECEPWDGVLEQSPIDEG